MIYIADAEFEITETNPFTGGHYDETWSILFLTNANEYQMMNGGEKENIYVLKISKRYPYWEMAVMDFVEYNKDLGKNIIISMSESDFIHAQKVYEGHSYNECCLRENESKVLVHSTTLKNWQSMESDGCLKSWKMLKREKFGWEDEPIGKCLGDSEEFSEYVMFSNGGVSGEIVVSSKQKGFIEMNTDAEYIPGVRPYFDAQKITEDGLLIRDGTHLKVKNNLPLTPYLLFIADWKSVGLKTNLSTPKEFSKLADFAFENTK